MVIDTSAIIAVLGDEPEQRAFVEAIEAADVRLISVATLVETAIVIERRHGAEGARDLDRLLEQAAIDTVPVDEPQGKAARDGFIRFGRGRHRAGLNYGDCFSYALATTTGEPLLCKGNDFVHTDLVLAVRES